MPSFNENALIHVSEFADKYNEKILSDWREKSSDYKHKWMEALRFFFDHVFYQGRRNDLSKVFLDRSWGVLEDNLSDNSSASEARYESLWQDGTIPDNPSWHKREVSNRLLDELKQAEVSKRGDRELVVDTLRFLRNLPRLNIVNRSISKIKGGCIAKHYQELQKIRYVGPKTAAFYLRDLCFVYSLKVEEDDLAVQPVDRWVKKIACRIKISLPEDGEDAVAGKIVEACKHVGVSPLCFNAGAWYMGTHALDILFEPFEGG